MADEIRVNEILCSGSINLKAGDHGHVTAGMASARGFLACPATPVVRVDGALISAMGLLASVCGREVHFGVAHGRVFVMAAPTATRRS